MKKDIGDFVIEGTLVNIFKAATAFKLRIRVTNTPPKFLTQFHSNVDIENYENKEIILPSIIDKEKNSWEIKAFER